MDKSAIPRLGLETFAKENYKVPFLSVEPHAFDASHFSIKDRKFHPVNDYISPNRRQFFKLLHITRGAGILTIGLHQYSLSPGDLVFIHPDEIIAWQASGTKTAEQGGHFCLIHPRYLEEVPHMLQLFMKYPYFQAAKAVIQLTESQSARIDQSFRAMLEEEESHHADKKQAIFLHLQMILLEAQRAGKNLADAAVPENYRYIHGFLHLLEAAFQIKGPDTVVNIKSAAEFAGQLHVHPNYLNSLVKTQTGKTLREHIQERLLYEAKVLLRHTDWDIKTISYVLGFSGQAAFTSFFTKKEKVSPSLFRTKQLSPANS